MTSVLSTSPPAAAPPAAAGAAWTVVARAEDLTGDGPWAVAAGAVELVLVRSGGALRAFEGLCPHQGALLGEGELSGGQLVCRNHRWRFDAATGQRQGGPQCLRACPLEVRDGAVHVDVRALAAGHALATRGGAMLRRPEDLPGPRGLPWLGNALQLSLPRLHLVLERWAARYGTPYTFRIGRQRVVAVGDRETAEAALRERPERYKRFGEVVPVFRELGIDGVFSAEGAAWRPQRRLSMQALSHKHLKGFYPTLREVAERLRGRWARAAAAGEAVDVQDDLMRFTVDVTVALVFGHPMNTVEGGEDVIQTRLARVLPAVNRRLFALVPYWRLLRLPRDRALDRALAEVRAWIGELLAAARARLAADPGRAERPQNFLEAMLAARDEQGEPYPEELLYGNALTMLLAGEDTTANTLAWAVHELCEHPEAVAALRGELDAALGPGGGPPPDMEAAGRLAFTAAVANETMRLRPVAPLLMFECLEDGALGDLALPAGTTVAVLTRALATGADRFADAKAFRPERWIDSQRPTGPHDAASHIPFGSGPRICPGRTLALLEMKVILATLYREFEVERVGAPEDVAERFAFTMSPVGLRVRLRRRAGDGTP